MLEWTKRAPINKDPWWEAEHCGLSLHVDVASEWLWTWTVLGPDELELASGDVCVEFPDEGEDVDEDEWDWNYQGVGLAQARCEAVACALAPASTPSLRPRDKDGYLLPPPGWETYEVTDDNGCSSEAAMVRRVVMRASREDAWAEYEATHHFSDAGASQHGPASPVRTLAFQACTFCNCLMMGDDTGRIWCWNAECPANVPTKLEDLALPRPVDGKEPDYEWADDLVKVMVTNDNPRGILNLCLCYAQIRRQTSFSGEG